MSNDSREASYVPFHADGVAPLRVWPPILLVILMVVLRSLPSFVSDITLPLSMVAGVGPLVCTILLLLWWLLASRALWKERIVGLIGIALACVVTVALVDDSMRFPASVLFTFPLGGLAFGVAAIVCSKRAPWARTGLIVLVTAAALCFSIGLRTEGMWGSFQLGFNWRWAETVEDRVLTQDLPLVKVVEDAETIAALKQDLAEPEWPAFRGHDRSSQQDGSLLATDWSTEAPEELWKIDVGPAWSSFVVAGDLLYTQEQRGDAEAVVCYRAETGEVRWIQEVQSRFEDPLGGPGPRATPTLAEGSLYVLGAAGLLLKIDALTGEIGWQQDLQVVAGRKPPQWGFSSSPLVVGDVVVVYGGGPDTKGTLAFDTTTGALRWSAAGGDHSYSSPQLWTVSDERLILMLTNEGLDLLDPASGASRLNYAWPHRGYRALQPLVIDETSLLVTTGAGTGSRRIRIARDGETLSAEALWTSKKLRPDFNDCVIYQGYAYGFDGAHFTCIDLENGEQQWRGGRYGKGQVLLVEDSGLLLVAGEKGEIVLVKADPSEHRELTRFQALDGKTWNHPVVVGDHLYVRNAQEAACFRLPLAAPTADNSPPVPT